MSESEVRAQAFVSGFCISDGRGMLGRPHVPWTYLFSVDLARSK